MTCCFVDSAWMSKSSVHLLTDHLVGFCRPRGAQRRGRASVLGWTGLAWIISTWKSSFSVEMFPAPSEEAQTHWFFSSSRWLGDRTLRPRSPVFSAGVSTVCVWARLCARTVHIGSLSCGWGRARIEPYVCVDRTCVFLCAPCSVLGACSRPECTLFVCDI